MENQIRILSTLPSATATAENRPVIQILDLIGYQQVLIGQLENKLFLILWELCCVILWAIFGVITYPFYLVYKLRNNYLSASNSCHLE